MREFSTPMMQQYMEIKKQYQDYMLFFRLGDFYELFLDDALVGAKILGIALTRRPRGKDGDIPMAGVPFHSAELYIQKLLKAGKKIAICEQITPPGKGIIERKVVRIITPGTIVDDKSLDQKKHNYILSVSIGKEKIGIAAIDVLTGDFLVSELEKNEYSAEQIGTEMSRFSPSECVVSLDTYNDPELLHLVTAYHSTLISYFRDWNEVQKNAQKILELQFSVQSATVFGLETLQEAAIAAATLVSYLNHTQQTKVTHLNFPTVYTPNQTVLLDPASIANLELFTTIRGQTRSGSLIDILDKTQTAMGGRLLRSWVSQPLRNSEAISKRQQAIAELYAQKQQREELQKKLQEIFDFERLLAKLALGVGTAASVLNIKQSLLVFLELQPVVKKYKNPLFADWKNLPISNIKKVVDDLEKTLVSKLDENNQETGVIRDGINKELDTLRTISASAKEWVADFEVQERKRTGISSLKCRYNQVFGFYIEVSRSNLHLIPNDYIRKQTMVNAERFITPALKKQEEIIVGADAKISQLERELFEALIERILVYLADLKAAAHALAELDCLASLAQLAQEERYVQPTITIKGNLSVKGGKHPVLSVLFKESFVPNDVSFDESKERLLLITGPNMAGKSVYMRQVALLVLLAHIGSFVPAQEATIPLTDRIFVRSGAADNISRGLSTFMVEMVEAAYILHQTTSHSLVIMDEIGRGTSTYDGISIAWAIAEYLVTEKNKQPKVLFATHYHELQALEEKYPEKIKNYQVIVKEESGKPVFLYLVEKGAASHSFGIAVAQLAGLPKKVLDNAQAMLHILENGKKIQETNDFIYEKETANRNPIDSVMMQKIKKLDINDVTPLQALQLLSELQKDLEKDD